MRLLKTFIKFVFGKELASTSSLFYRSAQVLLIQLCGALLLFLNNYLIIKFAGDQNYGTYISIVTWISLFSVIVSFGMDDLFIAVLPKYIGRVDKRAIFNVLVWATKVVGGVFVITSLTLAFLIKTNILQELSRYQTIHIYILLLLLTFMSLLISFLRSMNRIVIGQLLDKILRPLLMILVLISFVVVSVSIHYKQLLVIQILVLIVCISSILYLFRGGMTGKNDVREIRFDKSLRPNFNFLLISLLNLLTVRLDILFLTETVSAQEVGYYNIAVRFADLINYPVVILNLIVPTLLSKALTDANTTSFHRTVQSTIRISIILTCCALGGMILFGKYILALFGDGFIEGYYPIIVLGISHLLTAFSGPLNALFMVGGMERISLYCLAANVLLSLIGCYFLIPFYYMIGAALSVLIGNFAYLVLITYFYYKKEGVYITPFKIFNINRVSK